MNQHGSSTRFFRARNLFEGTIAPPADLTITEAEWVTQIANPIIYSNFGRLNTNSNLLIKAAGIYSNFADGLVFKNANERLDLKIVVGGYNPAAVATGTLTTTAGSKTATYTGTLTAGQLIICGSEIYRCATSDGAGNATLADYARLTHAGVNFYLLTQSGGGLAVALPDISQLNHLFDIDFFFDFSYAGITTAPTYVIMQLSVNQDFTTPAVLGHDVDFLTKSISDDFEDDAVYFDAAVQVEFTSVTP